MDIAVVEVKINNTDQEKLEAFKSEAAQNAISDLEIYLIKAKSDPDLWGFLHVSEEVEHIDNHCGQCLNEKIVIFGFNKCEVFPYKSLIGTIGPTKFLRILNGETSLLGDVTLDIKLV